MHMQALLGEMIESLVFAWLKCKSVCAIAAVSIFLAAAADFGGSLADTSGDQAPTSCVTAPPRAAWMQRLTPV